MPDLEPRAVAEAAFRGAAKATYIGVIPALCLILLGGYGSVLIVVAGVPLLFVVGAAGWEVYQEFWFISEPPPPPAPQLGPTGVFSQDEAERHLDDLIAEFWEREQ
ncbi:hypothetical protein TA3x_005804 (plasmid) [Tundrisphaera sp. TA3]|uniref:hypothetical protein n=1 Tax=Tundrisphaera sp. TA3 TaxID=3435775 RepID=UPI003EB87D7A